MSTLIQNHINPIAIDLRTQRLNIIKRYMNSDRLTAFNTRPKRPALPSAGKNG
jgi:hypothetical protein